MRGAYALPKDPDTRVWFDARNGRLFYFQGPLGENATDATMRWFYMLHMARVFGLPYRIFVSLLGFAVVVLTVTGILIWMKKRSARLLSQRRSAGARAVSACAAVSAASSLDQSSGCARASMVDASIK